MRPGLDRRAAWVLLGLSGGVLVAGLALLVPWDWVPGGRLVPADPADFFTGAELARAEERGAYVRPRAWAATAVGLAAALALASGPGRRLVGRVVPSRSWWVSCALAVLVLRVVQSAVTLPLAWQIRERNLLDGLTTQSAAGWWRDRGVSLLVGWVGLSLVVLVVVGCARRWPRRWFVPAGLGMAGLVLAGSFVTPLVVEPLFNRFEPMPDGALRSDLVQLARSEGVDVGSVLVADASRRTTTLNAYVSGFGGSKRLVVYDNLLEQAPADEVRTVVAHEVAHAAHRDVLVGTGLGAAAACAAVCLLALGADRLRRRRPGADVGSPQAVLPLLAVVAVATLLVSPVQNAASRAVEARADRDSLAATDDPAGFEALQQRLALRSVADPTPPRWAHLWWGSHPTTAQRLGLPSSLEAAR